MSRLVLCVYVSIAIYTVCKSWISVNHLHLHVQTFYTYIVDVYIFIFTLTWPCIIVLRCVSVYTKVIHKVTLSLGLLSPSNRSCSVSIKWGNFIKSGYEMLKVTLCHFTGLSPKIYEIPPYPQKKLHCFILMLFYETI